MTHAMRATHAMHRGRHGRGLRHGCGPGGGRRRAFDRQEWLARLEEYQRDLEQETADVADLIRRLKEEERPAGTAEV
jgi:hypothetical protein